MDCLWTCHSRTACNNEPQEQ